jgi:hypothetical protein
MTADLSPAYQEWHCGECHNSGLLSENDGTMRCETCGATYEPDGRQIPYDDSPEGIEWQDATAVGSDAQ